MVDQNVKKSIEIADYVYVLNSGAQQPSRAPARSSRSGSSDIIREWL